MHAKRGKDEELRDLQVCYQLIHLGGDYRLVGHRQRPRANGRDRLERAHACERIPAGDDVEKAHSQCPHVRAYAVRLRRVLNQLGLGERERWPGANEIVTYRRVRFRSLNGTDGDRLRYAHLPADAEIAQLVDGLLVHEHVLRFDVAMQDSTGFEEVQRRGDLPEKAACAGWWNIERASLHCASAA